MRSDGDPSRARTRAGLSIGAPRWARGMHGRRSMIHSRPEDTSSGATTDGVLLKKARKPPISVPHDLTVMAAVHMMVDRHVGALLVLEDGRPAGIFTERDLMIKVTLAGRAPERVLVRDVMTSPVLHIHEDASLEEAVELTLERRIDHLPVVDRHGRVQGMLSMRHVVEDAIDELKHSVSGLEAYVGYDGAGG
jgi:CBS domain-containing protein